MTMFCWYYFLNALSDLLVYLLLFRYKSSKHKTISVLRSPSSTIIFK